MAIKLNEYPKDQLEELLNAVTCTMTFDRVNNLPGLDPNGYLQIWYERIKEAIADQEFNNKQLNFNAPNT